MNARTLNGGRQMSERLRVESNRWFNAERSGSLLGRHICERDFRRLPFLTPQTGPKRSTDDFFNDGGVWSGRVAKKLERDNAGFSIGCEAIGDDSCSGIRWSGHTSVSHAAAIDCLAKWSRKPLAPVRQSVIADKQSGHRSKK